MKSELIPLMAEIRNWLAGSYGPLPAGVTLLIKPAEFETAVLGSLSDEEVREARKNTSRRGAQGDQSTDSDSERSASRE